MAMINQFFIFLSLFICIQIEINTFISGSFSLNLIKYNTISELKNIEQKLNHNFLLSIYDKASCLCKFKILIENVEGNSMFKNIQ